MKKYSNSREAHVFDSIVGSAGKLLAGLFGVGKAAGTKRIRKEELAERWGQIDELVSLGGPAHLKQAIVEADKLLDRVLASHGFTGSLADKLRAGERRMSKQCYDAAWQAHKLRNRIVHDEGEMFDFEMKRGLDQFRKAINELS